MNVASEKSIKKVILNLKENNIKIDCLVNNACLNPKFSNKFSLKTLD